MAIRRSNFRPGKKIDFKEWTSLPSIIVAVSTDTTIIFGSIGFTFPATILRCRGYVQAAFDASGLSVGDRMRLIFGLGLVSTDAFTAGAASVPDPAEEPGYPWLWYGMMQLAAESTTLSDTWGPQAQRLEVDTKAMRKVKPNETLVMVVQSTAAAGAPGVNVDIPNIRILFGT